MKNLLAFSVVVFFLSSVSANAQPKSPPKPDLDKLLQDLDSKDINVRINAAVGLAEFGAHLAVNFGAVSLAVNERLNREPPGRRFFDRRDLKVSVKHQCQATRNRGCTHQ